MQTSLSFSPPCPSLLPSACPVSPSVLISLHSTVWHAFAVRKVKCWICNQYKSATSCNYMKTGLEVRWMVLISTSEAYKLGDLLKVTQALRTSVLPETRSTKQDCCEVQIKWWRLECFINHKWASSKRSYYYIYILLLCSILHLSFALYYNCFHSFHTPPIRMLKFLGGNHYFLFISHTHTHIPTT